MDELIEAYEQVESNMLKTMSSGSKANASWLQLSNEDKDSTNSRKAKNCKNLEQSLTNYCTRQLKKKH